MRWMFCIALVLGAACTDDGFDEVRSSASGQNGILNPYVPQCWITLVDGTWIRVENATSDSNCTDIQTLVRYADSSTRWSAYAWVKGLISAGDRIFVSNDYLAWFDYSVGDGVTHPTLGYQPVLGGGGSLAGYWTLNGESRGYSPWFAFPKDVGYGGWAPNELIRGSAGFFGDYWWDSAAGGGVANQIYIGAGYSSTRFAHWSGQNGANSGWYILEDGVDLSDGSGVAYTTGTYLASFPYNQVDVTDANDSNGIAGRIASNLRFKCQPTRIVVEWSMQPQVTVYGVDNVTAGETYLAYSAGEDGTACDAGGDGYQWPLGDIWWGEPKHTRSNLAMFANPYQSCGARSVCDMSWPPWNSGSRCPSDPNDPNRVLWVTTQDGHTLAPGDSLEVWSDYTTPHFWLENLLDPAYQDPYALALPYDHLTSWNEELDGAAGIGMYAGPYNGDASRQKVLYAGWWYQTQYSLEGGHAWTSSLVGPHVFDARYYGEHNADLSWMTTQELRSHWLDYGMFEGRQPSAMFNPAGYLQHQPDIAAACGGTGPWSYACAANHFTNYGYWERRSGL